MKKKTYDFTIQGYLEWCKENKKDSKNGKVLLKFCSLCGLKR